MPRLGVNVDHVATLRQARGGSEPDPVQAACTSELAGADSIVVHLREDRRHIQERDVRLIREAIRRLNLEMSIAPEIVEIAKEIGPQVATLVPERRQELTTEGGLDVVSGEARIRDVIEALQEKGIAVSLFIDPERRQIEASKRTKADSIELHTGRFASARSDEERERTLAELKEATTVASDLGMHISAGHGLDYRNVQRVAQIRCIEELNIGHSIISRAISVGLERAVREMTRMDIDPLMLTKPDFILWDLFNTKARNEITPSCVFSGHTSINVFQDALA